MDSDLRAEGSIDDDDADGTDATGAIIPVAQATPIPNTGSTAAPSPMASAQIIIPESESNDALPEGEAEPQQPRRTTRNNKFNSARREEADRLAAIRAVISS
ncbi:expressed unknown protein [Seminavis robusta]|uniref:Uncharacterized protein n=1 Tax=Seminavis robusta TaxID=568900 RepID=A0A9N8HB65_9STRA|nr:expressed unknown protein [Seminavis robusta]|eukprot:Sro266_g103210.1 n/a (102) ;mRNA; f:50927-51232